MGDPPPVKVRAGCPRLDTKVSLLSDMSRRRRIDGRRNPVRVGLRGPGGGGTHLAFGQRRQL